MDLYCDAFRVEKERKVIQLFIKNKSKLKDIAKTPWLQEGRLVLVYKPTRTDTDSQKASRKLLYQFSGPFRITKVYKNSLQLANLDGSPADTQGVGNCFPYNRRDDKFLAPFDANLSPEELNDSFNFKVGDMAIVNGSTNSTKKVWYVVRIEEIDDGGYICRYFNTYDKHKDVTKRAYLPCWIDAKHVEYFSHTRNYRADEPFEERFDINDFICWPFILSKRGRVPAEIIEKLQIDGFLLGSRHIRPASAVFYGPVGLI